MAIIKISENGKFCYVKPGLLDGAGGEQLALPAYYSDFQERFERSAEFWKLERGQVFAEPGSESWEAFDRGDWDESLRLIEARRPGFADYQRRNEARGMNSRRVRIVELPPSPYLHWELRLLLLRHELGQPTRVLPARDVADLEEQGPLPEISTLDSEAMYKVVYDADGAASHAVRFTDTALVGRCRDLIASLYERGEPISDFFQREIAPLPPPRRT